MPLAASHPRTYAWYELVSKFPPATREKWPASGAGGKSKPSSGAQGQSALNIGDLEAFYKAAKKRFDDESEFHERAKANVVKL